MSTITDTGAIAAPVIHLRFTELRTTLPHVRLGVGPTPVRQLNLGTLHGKAPVWLKDDGMYGSVYGGNKVRKLEWLLADAARRGARAIFTVGGLGTNHGLATALYGQAQGLRTTLALVDQPFDEHVEAQLRRLRQAADVHLTHTILRTAAAAPFLIAALAVRDRRLPYILGPGGSSPLGALGYVEAALELAGQVETGDLPEPSHVVVAVGSQGTAAGLSLGLKLAGLKSRVVGIAVAHQLRLRAETVARLAQRSCRLLFERGAPIDVDVTPDDIDVTREWLGTGYGHPTSDSTRALAVARDLAQLNLDPVYTAKAFAALLALNLRGFFGEGPVLFINTYDALSSRRAEAEPSR